MKRTTILLFILICQSSVMMSQPIGRQCEASFIHSQDQANHMIVNFISTSVGNITEYHWDFGDGSTFTGENPSHAYPYTGDFTVCLSISGSDTLQPCADTACQEVTVTIDPLYNIGGLLFAGTFPINNPEPSGDTAFAYLYLIGQGSLTPVDSTYFDTLGYFWFAGVPEGKYLLKAGLLESSVRFSQFLPAYHGDCLYWTDADTLLVDQNIYDIQIHMIRGNPVPQGTGHIHGWLMMEQTQGGPQPIAAGQVMLTNQAGTPYYCTYTNAGGEFLFSGIPAGEYKVFSEYTGMFSKQVTLMLDDNHPSSDSLEVLLYGAIPGTEDPRFADPIQLTVFPNPAENSLFLQLSLKRPEQVQVNLYNPMGRLVRNGQWTLPAGRIQKELNVAELAPGIYLISVQGIRSNGMALKKFIKK